MGSIFSTPKPIVPALPPAPAPPPEVDNNVDAEVAAEEARKRALLAQGRSSTILTGSRGVENEATTERKTLLGQ